MNQEVRDPFLEGNEIIEEAISTFHADQSNENLISVHGKVWNVVSGDKQKPCLDTSPSGRSVHGVVQSVKARRNAACV